MLSTPKMCHLRSEVGQRALIDLFFAAVRHLRREAVKPGHLGQLDQLEPAACKHSSASFTRPCEKGGGEIRCVCLVSFLDAGCMKGNI